ncbi:hypothetical protein AAC387_Pa06g2311 [Persea americana]
MSSESCSSFLGGEGFDATAQPWFRVVANLSDSTGTISATLFGNEMKKLTSCTPIQMMNLFEEGRVDDIEDVVNKFNGQEHIFQLKAYHYGSAVNFTVLSIHDIRGDNTNEGNIVVQKSKGGVFFQKGGEVLSIGAEVGGVKAATKV